MPDVVLPPRPALVVIRDVPILEVGENWPASTGPATFTPDDLAAAVAAQDDPSVRSPILRLGHVRAGQPAFGRLDNLRLTNEGMTLVADIVGAPAWLADLMPYAWPSRSVEATRNATSGTGRTHLLQITALALLGVELPAVSTLDEVAAIYTAESMEQAGVTLTDTVAAARGGAMPDPISIAATLTTEDVRRAYYDALGPGQDWWWIREMQLDPLALIVDDDEGGLWQVPVTVSGDSVAFGQPTAVRVEYVAQDAGNDAIAASSARSRERRAIVFADRAESRGGLMDPVELRRSLGLAEDATDEQVMARAAELAARPDPTASGGSTSAAGGDGDADAGGGVTAPPATAPVPVAASATQVPPGMVLISQANLDAMQQGIEQGVQAGQILARQAEDEFIRRNRSRIGASTNPHAQLVEENLRGRFRADRAAAETFAASLAHVVPTVAAGHESPGDDSLDAEWEKAEAAWFPDVAEVRNARRTSGGS